MRIRLTPALITVIGMAALQAEDGKLQRAKDEVHRPAPSSSSSRPGTGTTSTVSGSYASSNDDGDSLLNFLSFIGNCFVWPADADGPAAGIGVARYPYHDGWNGYFAPIDSGRQGRLFGGEVYGEYGLIDSDIDRYAIGGRVFCSALALRTEWNRYLERLPSGGSDSLTLGTIDIELGIPIGRYARIGVGVGSTIIHDQIGTESGACLVVGVDVFPMKPLVVHSVFTYGSVSEDEFDPPTSIMTLRATLGVTWNHYEAYAGWQSTWIETVQLDGPTAGLRAWF